MTEQALFRAACSLGDRVLDIASGTGILPRRLAAAAGFADVQLHQASMTPASPTPTTASNAWSSLTPPSSRSSRKIPPPWLLPQSHQRRDTRHDQRSRRSAALAAVHWHAATGII